MTFKWTPGVKGLRKTSLYEKRPYSEFPGPHFPAFGPYSVQMRETKDQKNFECGKLQKYHIKLRVTRSYISDKLRIYIYTYICIYMYIYVYINIYITLILLLWDLSTLCVVDHLWPLIHVYIYIYISITWWHLILIWRYIFKCKHWINLLS